MCCVLGKHSPRKYYDEPVKKPYRKLVVDEMPIIKTLEKLDYKKLIADQLKATGKLITPVKRRKPSTVPETITCPRCNAPHDYLYDNTGGRGQYLCKVCECTFNKKNYYLKNLLFCCPHCGKVLTQQKQRKDFNIHKCKNPKCPYYLNKLNSMSFVAYFNFLRPHSTLEGKVPVVLEELSALPNMPARWQILIKMSQAYIETQQSA
jgi:hypothetical protein